MILPPYDGTTLLGSSMITIPTGTFDQDYLYILGGGSCPLDTAILRVSKPSSLAYNVQVSSNFICEDECVTVTIDHLDTDQDYRYIYQIADDIGWEQIPLPL